MKTTVDHDQTQAASKGAPEFECETQEDFALAIARIKALASGQRSEEEELELHALREAVRAWDGRETESPVEREA